MSATYIIPATPGHFVREHEGATRYPVIAWHILTTGNKEFPTVSVQAIAGDPTSQCMNELKVIEFPDGHVEYFDGIYDTYEDYVSAMQADKIWRAASASKKVGVK